MLLRIFHWRYSLKHPCLDDFCISSNVSVTAGPHSIEMLHYCKLANVQQGQLGTIYSKTLLAQQLLKNAFHCFTGWRIAERRERIGCHINYIMAQFIIGTRAHPPCELPADASMGFRCTPWCFLPAYLWSTGRGL